MNEYSKYSIEVFPFSVVYMYKKSLLDMVNVLRKSHVYFFSSWQKNIEIISRKRKLLWIT